MRVQLKVGENCSISKIDDTKLQIKLNIPLNNFNNSTYKDNTRIYIENINFPKIKDRNGVDVSQGVVDISSSSIEPDYNDFNSYQNINLPNTIFTAKIDDFQYNSSSPELYNFKINTSFINNCSFILDFKENIGIHTEYLRNVSRENEIASSGTTPAITIVSGKTDTSRTIVDIEILATSYTVSRNGNVLPQPDYAYLYGINWIFNYDPLGDTVDSVQFPASTPANQFPYKGLGYEIGDVITFDKSIFGGGSTDDLVIKVDNIQISEIEQYRINLNNEIDISIEDRDKLLQSKQAVLDFNTYNITQYQLTLYFLQNTAIPKWINFLKKRLTDNELLAAVSNGKLGVRRVLMIQNAISTAENGGQSNLFYLFLHTTAKIPFWQSTSSSTIANIHYKIFDDDGDEHSLYSATQLVLKTWNLYWTMLFETKQLINNKNWFYGEVPTFTKYTDRFDGGSLFPTKSQAVWKTATGANNFDTSSMVRSVSSSFTVSGDPTKKGDITFDYLILREEITNKYNMLIAVSDFNRDDERVIETDKLVIPVLTGEAFQSIKTHSISTGETDSKRKIMLSKLFIVNQDDTSGNGKQAHLGISVDSTGKAIVQFPADATLRGKDFAVGDFIYVPAEFFESKDEAIPADEDLTILVDDVYQDTNGFELTITETKLLDTGLDKNFWYYTYIIEQKQAEELVVLAKKFVLPSIQETASYNYAIVDYILEYNLYNNASISLNIYNEDQEDTSFKPKKSIFKQNNYSTTPLCPSRRYIR